MAYSRNNGGGVSAGDKGDITVAANGNWTIDNLAVTNAKINDVAATKVTEDSTHRFTTDTEKSTWNAKQDALSNASASTNGILTSADWNTFNGKQNVLSNASATVSGILTSTDWNTFNGKQAALGFTAVPNTRSISTTSPLSGGGDLSANRTLSISQANGSTSGFLSNTDWTTFNNKLSSITTASAFITAGVSISTATYADITGASISLAAGTWMIFATINGFAANTAFVMFAAITDSANAIIAEAAQNCPASGTASSNNWTSVAMTAFVSPASTTTYKLRAARGNTAPTGTWTASDGIGTNTANNGTNNSDKSTGIFAIKLA